MRPVQLSPQAIAALPFSLDLKGARVTERSGPSGTKIYTVAKGEVPLLMIYTGPQADYPIYAGEEAVVAGRTSILVSDGGSRKAVEHLFRRDGSTPRDIHVWLLTTDGLDGMLAEQIGQTVDPR